MKKIIASSFLLANMVLLELFGCSFLPSTVQIPTFTPSPILSPTATPPFFHYTSVSRSDIYLEFDYPSSWGLGDDLQRNEISVALYEPRFFTLPTQSPNENHPIPNDFGVIDIWIRPLKSDESFEEFIQEFAKDERYDHKTVLDNYTTQIAGVNAVIVEVRLDKNYAEIHIEEMFVRDIFFTMDNLIYKIGFTIAVGDRGNEFEKGYEYLVKSLKLIP